VSSSSGNGHHQRLDSWKEIATYLRRDERTAIRWEKDRGLPVHRVPGGKRKAVFAFTAELDSWLTRENPAEIAAVIETSGAGSRQGLKPPPSSRLSDAAESVPSPVNRSNGSHGVPSEAIPEIPVPASRTSSEMRDITDLSPRHRGIPGGWWYVCAAVALIGVISIALVIVRRAPLGAVPDPAQITFSGDSAHAFDGQGHLLWTHTFRAPLASLPTGDYSDLVRMADFRGDGGKEALVGVSYRYPTNASDPIGGEVDLFSSDGRLLWAYVPDEQFQFGQHTIAKPWGFMDVFVSPQDHNRIWATFSNGVWGNSFVLNLDPVSGKPTLRFVNTGTTHQISEIRNNGKTYLLVAGFNNEPDTASLAVIDETRAFAASPQTPGTRHYCVSCPAGSPDYYFVFPRSEINEIQQFHEYAVGQMHVSGNEVEVIEETYGENNDRVHYGIHAADTFYPASIRFDSNYDMQHKQYEREGKLNHSIEMCPERLRPRPIRMWTPSGGWKTVQLPPTPFNQ